MSRVIWASIGLILVAVVGFCAFRFQAKNQRPASPMSTSSFPARPICYFLEMHSSNGTHSKEYVNGNLKRLEIYSANSELPQLHIYRPDKGVSWTAMPGSTTLREFRYSLARGATAKASDSLVAWTQEGTAEIEGCKCIRFVGKYVDPPADVGYFVMDPGRAYEESFIDAANGLPVRHITYDRFGKPAVVNERIAFNLNPPEAALFEIPLGYAVESVESDP
jgi:hypothetical protein